LMFMDMVEVYHSVVDVRHRCGGEGLTGDEQSHFRHDVIDD